jgi:gliding motility associated protien GldN
LKWYNTQDVVQYRIKEDWFFDKERSVLDVRIIAIAPVIQETTIDANGNKSFGRMRELFWLYFPHCRFVFNNYFVYNDQNDAQWMSFDDLFWKRRFNSTIYKESNTFDRNIESYRMGVDALMEAEKIKEEIRVIEHDVWSF